jgi:YVTN family beta-propeller protein
MGGAEKILRRAGIVAAIATVFACAFAASAGAAPLLWTANHDSRSVSTINTATNQVVGTSIPTGEFPESIAITPNGRRAFVVNFGGDSVTVIETATRTPVATVPLPSNGERVAVSPDGKTAYVTSESNEHVFEIDTETATEVGSITVGPDASALAFTPSGKQAYVGVGPEDVQVVETATGKLVGGPIEVGGFAEAIAFTPGGETAYVAAGGEVDVIDTALGKVVAEVPIGAEVSGLAVSPDGKRLYVASPSEETVTVIETATSKIVGTPIAIVGKPEEIAITPSGATAYVADGTHVTPINLATGKTATQISAPGVFHLVVAPDQSPTAVFTPPSVTTFVPAAFSGAASTDPDGSIVSWNWSFGDGGVASGVNAVHTYVAPGTYDAQLSVVDNEGCGEAEVFTGRTAYCSGGPSKVTHPVEAKTAVTPVVCSARFHLGRLIHVRKNGTARLQVTVPAAGTIFLFGKKVHAVSRKAKKKGSMWLTIHARVELNKRLKRIHHASVRIRVTFTPNAGCGFHTVHRSLSLLRAKKKHHRG